jgi:glycerophosphoryl diester phosphodiesterase
MSGFAAAAALVVLGWLALHIVLRRSAETDVVAHRGAAGEAPENTLAAVRAGTESGAGYLEIDTRRSADRAFVVIHDATVDRTTDGSGQVAAMTTSQLRALDAGGWFAPSFAGERIPLLAEVLENLVDWDGGLVVEVKDPEMNAEVGEQLVAELQAGPFHRILLVSFDHEWLRLFRGLLPSAPSGELSIYPWPLPDGSTVELVGVFWLAPILDPTLVWRAHRRGLEIWVWTTDHPWLIRLVHWLGVDGVTTNFPGRANRLLRQSAGRSR